MTAAQLALTAPGFCRRCSLHRLSVADRDGICCHCQDHERYEAKPRAAQPNRPTQFRARGGLGPLPVVAGVKLCRCRRGPPTTRGYCIECCREYDRKYKRQYKALREEAQTQTQVHPDEYLRRKLAAQKRAQQYTPPPGAAAGRRGAGGGKE